MKLNLLIKATPFLSILLIITCLSIGNNKEYTKLRVLIWDTPSLSLGTYLALSTGTGFIISYLVTNNLARLYQSNPKKILELRDEVKYEDNNDHSGKSDNIAYDNTLIERDIKDPSPTINASFRVIGIRERSSSDFINNNNHQYTDSMQLNEQYNYQTSNDETINQVDQITSDWNDESYSKW